VNAAGVPLNVRALAPVKALPVIVTLLPILPEPGLNDEMVGMTPNAVELDPLPTGVVTVIGPVSAPDGTLAVIVESETTVKLAAMLLNVTADAPVKALPLIVTDEPTVADAGEKAVMLGAGSDDTVNKSVVVAVPVGVVTLIDPLVAAAGTTAVNWVSDPTLKLAVAPLKATAVVPVKPLPVSVTDEPGHPDPGVNDVIVGAGGGVGGGIGNGVAVAPLFGAVPRLK
jgi:hypothetical protein